MRVSFSAYDVNKGYLMPLRSRILGWLVDNAIDPARTKSVRVLGRLARVESIAVDRDGFVPLKGDDVKTRAHWRWLRVPFPKELVE